jgi:PAS domain-containing protein
MLEPPLTLDDHQRLLAMVVRSAPIVLWAIDNNGVFLLSEGRGLDVLGLKPGEVVGESAFDLYLQHPQVLEDLRRALQGESVTSTVEVGDLTFDTRSLPMRDAAGNQTAARGGGRDRLDPPRALRRRGLSAALPERRSRWRGGSPPSPT